MAQWAAASVSALPGADMPAGPAGGDGDVKWSSIWLLRGDLASDFEKYQVYNPSLMQVVQGLQDAARENEAEVLVAAPGEERLPFFFPQNLGSESGSRAQIKQHSRSATANGAMAQMVIIDDALLTSLDELESLGATHIVYGAKAREAYLDAGIDPERTQLIAALGRHDLFEKIRWHYHGVFSYELYQVGDMARRRQLPARFAARQDELERIIFDGRLRLYPEGLHPQAIHEEMPITFEPTWQALQPIAQDYEFLLQVRHPNGEVGYEWRFLRRAPSTWRLPDFALVSRGVHQRPANLQPRRQSQFGREWVHVLARRLGPPEGGLFAADGR